MFKLISIAAVIALLSACSGMGGSMSRSGGSTMGATGGMPDRSNSSTTNNGDGPN